ncbi:MAG: ribosomal protein L13e [Candidatus Bathyarchaeota archaeon]|nr:ribosomal protein L13e [Candidatus Bathyarchaeota archaeon]
MVEDIYAFVKKGRTSRKGRGFSSYELKEAGLSIQQALELGIPIDPKRSTRYDKNVDALKTYRIMEATPRAHAIDLREVKGIGQKRAEQLKAAGFDSVQKLAESEPQHVAEAVGVSGNRAANWIESAKLLLSS